MLFSLLTALVITCVSCFIEVVNRAKVSAKACFGTAFLMYLVLAIAGNGIATLLASSIFSTQLPSSLQPWTPFFSAFLGVFAFQGVLSHTNITVFKSALTFEDWIAKARDNAVADAVATHVQRTNQLRLNVATVLRGLPVEELNSYIALYLGPTAVEQLETAATQAHADPALYKALTLSSAKPGETDAIIRSRQVMNAPP